MSNDAFTDLDLPTICLILDEILEILDFSLEIVHYEALPLGQVGQDQDSRMQSHASGLSTVPVPGNDVEVAESFTCLECRVDAAE